MSYEQPTEVWSTEDIDHMLELLDPILAPGFDLANWPDRTHIGADGQPVLQFPYPDYHPIVGEFIQFCYDSSTFTDPYASLPEDPLARGEEEPATAQVLTSAEDMESATLAQIRRYFIILTRGERFCDGYIAQEFEDGVLQATVRPLRELRDAMEETA